MIMDFSDLAARCAPDIHITTLSSVVQHESIANPYAIGVNGNMSLPHQPKNKIEAITTAEWLKENGYDFDAGLCQINIRNVDHLGMSISDLFDPCANLRGAATILSDCYKRALVRYNPGQPALHAALSCYNTGNFFTGFSNGYVMNVIKKSMLQVPALLPEKECRLPNDAPISNQKHKTYNKKESVASEEKFPDAFSHKKYDAFFRVEMNYSD